MIWTYDWWTLILTRLLSDQQSLLAKLCLALFFRKESLNPSCISLERQHNLHHWPCPAVICSYWLYLIYTSEDWSEYMGKLKYPSCKHKQKSEAFVFNQQMTMWTQLTERDRPVKLFSLKGKYDKVYFQDRRPDPMGDCGQAGLALIGIPGVNGNWIPASTCIPRQSSIPNTWL